MLRVSGSPDFLERVSGDYGSEETQAVEPLTAAWVVDRCWIERPSPAHRD